MLGRYNALVLNTTTSNNDKSRHRYCEKYDGSTCCDNQQHIIESFTQPDGVIRVVVATVAFSMGLDSPNVHSVIHWGILSDISMYVQETGCGGRDGLPCNAVLYYNKHSQCKSSSMKEYCSNTTTCRRELLMSEFIENAESIAKPLPLHACCDICEHLCICDECQQAKFIPPELLPEFDSEPLNDIPIPRLSSEIKHSLQTQLKDYRASMCPSQHSVPSMMIGIELLTGLSDQLIDDITDSASYYQIKDVETLMNMGVGSRAMAADILTLINTVCQN